jgi:hypothetical protein
MVVIDVNFISGVLHSVVVGDFTDVSEEHAHKFTHFNTEKGGSVYLRIFGKVDKNHTA